MRTVCRGLPQMLVMAGVVTTALYVPVLAALAFAIKLFGVPLHAVLTFGGSLGVAAGLAAWWAILFIPAVAYSAWMMPWRGKPN